MKIFLSLFFLLSGFSSFADCTFKNEVKKVVSLSGTTTVLLKELGLLNHPRLIGISVFNPVDHYKGNLYPGGIFLSQSSFDNLKDAVVLFDESRDLRKILQSHKLSSLEIKTRNLTPYDSIESGLNQLKNLITSCEDKMKEVLNKARMLEEKITQEVSKFPTMIFYLGEVRNGRTPDLVMANDGVVKWLRDNKKIKTYPSNLAYVNWSSKIMHSLPKESLHIGLKDTGNSMKKEVKLKGKTVNVYYPGILVPGLSQLEGTLYLLKNL